MVSSSMLRLGTIVWIGFLAASPALAQPSSDAAPAHPWRTDYTARTANSVVPSAELQAVAPARAAAAAARTDLQLNRMALTVQVVHARNQLLRSDEFRTLKQAENLAYQDYQAACNRALAGVRGSSAYQSAQVAGAALAERIAQTHLQKSPDPVMLVSLATSKLRHVRTLSAMEEAALEQDPRVQAARQRWIAAAERVNQLYDRFDDAIRHDPDLIALRRQIRDGRVAAVAASAYERSATDVARAALDLAYFHSFYQYRTGPVTYLPASHYGCGGSYYGGYGR